MFAFGSLVFTSNGSTRIPRLLEGLILAGFGSHTRLRDRFISPVLSQVLSFFSSKKVFS